MAPKSGKRTQPRTLLDLAERGDDWLHGHRRTVWVSVAVLCVVGGPVLDHLLADEAGERASAALVLLFMGVTVALAMGRLARLRDDQRRGSFRRLRGRARTVFREFRRSVARARAARWTLWASWFGPALLRGSVVVLALRKVSQLLRVSLREAAGMVVEDRPQARMWVGRHLLPLLRRIWHWENDVQTWALFSLGLGGCLTVAAWLWMRRWQRAGRRSVVTGALPGVFQHTDGGSIAQAVEHTDDQVLHDVLRHLHRWRPGSLEQEWMYQEALAEWLQEHLPSYSYSLEEWFGSRAEGTRGRGDIIVDNWLLIEMKKGWSQSEGQRAVGQLDQYLRGWTGGRPLLTVVCAADPQKVAQAFDGPVHRYQQDGRVVLVAVVAP